MMLKIAGWFPNLCAEDWSMFSLWEGWQPEVSGGGGTAHLAVLSLRSGAASARGRCRAIFPRMEGPRMRG